MLYTSLWLFNEARRKVAISGFDKDTLHSLLDYTLAVAKFAADVISPRVRDMDERSSIDPAVISGLFENGLMGIEVPEEYGGE